MPMQTGPTMPMQTRPQPRTAPLALATALLVAAPLAASFGAPLAAQEAGYFTRADTLRGTITAERAWWDVHYYDLAVTVNPADSTISGSTAIAFNAVAPGRTMQIDLQEPMEVTAMRFDGRELTYRRDGNAFFVDLPRGLGAGDSAEILVEFAGRPVVAIRPPWDGGYIWARDAAGKPWVSTAQQGLGASAWWPNKDHQSDEPDSMQVAVTVPQPLVNVSNGRLRSEIDNGDGTTTWTWFIANPINNYNITVNAGSYVHFGETYDGLDGPLDLDYWVLEHDLERAKAQFTQVRPMMACFEEWFGPYPFYEDSFKLVQAPHLGMEHQSAVAYGNQFVNGYLGRDLSGTGWGMKWDFIIIHEAGHEWFGNNLTSEDVADMWVHEGFTAYSENIYTQCEFGVEAGADYVIGTRQNIQNDRPLIGVYGVQSEGSGDMYYKGANLLHTIRQVVNDDALWKSILVGLNTDFRHSIVTSAQVEAYISDRAGRDLSRVFDQYLRHTRIPVLQLSMDGDQLRYRWDADVEGFDLPVRVTLKGVDYTWIEPVTGEWRSVAGASGRDGVSVDRNFYVDVEWVH
jgi:aminopeptidase N